MAKNNNLGDFLKGIADKFRSKLGITGTINPQNFEDKIDAVYDAAAQKAYDDFWDAFQQNGNRYTYEYAFASDGQMRFLSRNIIFVWRSAITEIYFHTPESRAV